MAGPVPGPALQLQAIGNQAVQQHLRLTNPQIQRKERQEPELLEQIYVVRDTNIGLGAGRLVQNLEQFKREVMRSRARGKWTLVLAIHGSEQRVAAQSPPDWQRNAVFYDADAIDRIFSSDPQWVAWRDAYGPSYLSLVSCQITFELERLLIGNLTRHAAGRGDQSPGPTQSGQGLGHGCKPLSSTQSVSLDSGPIRTRKQYDALKPDEKAAVLQKLRDWNREYGYYGAPPVEDGRILRYYFDEAPAGNWVFVEVGRKQPDGSLQGTGIPFWNRTSGSAETTSRFHHLCDPAGALKPRQPGEGPP